LIADGRSYDQILQRHPALTYFDIFAAARAALDLLQAASTAPQRFDVPDLLEPDDLAPPAPSEPDARPGEPDARPVEPAPTTGRPSFIDRARTTHRRAWARWTRDEDARLTDLFSQGASRAAMEGALGRQPGAIRSRLLKLGLITEDDGTEPAAGAAVPEPPACELAALDPSTLELPATGAQPSLPAPRRRRSQSAPPSPIVPGWEAFRDRLGPGQDEA
jgi:hypothetical protein